MKNNKVSKVIFLVLVIILILSVIIALIIENRKKDKDLTNNMYNKICNLENYSFSMKEENTENSYSLIISKKRSDISIDSTTDGDHTTTITKGKDAYYVIHSKQEYYLYDNDEIDADFLKSELEGINEKEYNYGYEDINGKKYYYEEYDGITTFVINLNCQDESNVKTKFYYDGENIAYIKTTTDDGQEFLKIDFSEQIDDSLFEIPSDYAEI